MTATATTNAATAVSFTSATLNATVNAGGTASVIGFQYSTSSSFSAAVGSGFSSVNALATDSAGDLFVADSNTVSKITPGGTMTVVGSGFSSPQGIFVDSSGDVFVSDSGHSAVTEVHPDGTTQAIGSGFGTPYGIAVDAAGNVYVADFYFQNDAVYKIAPDGTQTTFASGFDSPSGLAIDSSGNLYVAEFYGNQIDKIAPDGTVQTLATGLADPRGVTVDSAGDVFVVDGGNDIIKEIHPGGAVTSIDTGFGSPTGVAIDSTGNLYAGGSTIDPNTFSSTSGVNQLTAATINATPGSLGSSVDTSVSATLTGLVAGTTYYDRVVSTASSGSIYGGTSSFTTTANPITPTLSMNPITIAYGTALAGSQISGTATATVGGNSVSVPGTFTFTTDTGSVFTAGAYNSEAVTFTPTDLTTYADATGTVAVTVSAVAPTLSTFSPIQITYGTALDNTQLVDTASWTVSGSPVAVAGTFAYTTDVGHVLNTGLNQAESVTFTPTDSIDYTPVVTSVGVNVSAAAGVSHVIAAGGVYTGSPFTATGTVTDLLGNVVASPTITYFSDTDPNNPVQLNGAPTNVGSYLAVASYAGTDFSAPDASQVFSITPASAQVSLSDLQQAPDGSAKAVTVVTTPTGLATSISYSQNSVAVTSPTLPGSYSVVVTVTDPNYTGSATGTLVIANATIDLQGLTQTYNASHRPVTAVTTPANLNVKIVYSQNGKNLSGAPTAAGSYNVSATITSAGYTGSAAGILVISQAVLKFKTSVTTAQFNEQFHKSTASIIAANSSDASSVASLVHTSYENLGTGVVTVTPPVNPGHYAVLASFAGNTNYVAIPTVDTGSKVDITPFKSLNSPRIVAQQHTVIVTGQVVAAGLLPGAKVSISFNGVSHTVKMNKTGQFRGKINTAKLAIGSYLVNYTYSAPGGIGTSTWTSTLNVGDKIAAVFPARAYRIGTIIPIAIKVINAAGTSFIASTVTATGIASAKATNKVIALPTGSDVGGIFTLTAKTRRYHLNLGTAGLVPGQYVLLLSVSGDPITHSVDFKVKS